MNEPTNPTEIGTRRRARQIRRRFDEICAQFERRTSTAYRLRGRAAHQLNEHMRRFWTARDRLNLQLHAARSCTPKRSCHLRERLDIEWRNLKDLVESPPTELATRAG